MLKLRVVFIVNSTEEINPVVKAEYFNDVNNELKKLCVKYSVARHCFLEEFDEIKFNESEIKVKVGISLSDTKENPKENPIEFSEFVLVPAVENILRELSNKEFIFFSCSIETINEESILFVCARTSANLATINIGRNS